MWKNRRNALLRLRSRLIGWEISPEQSDFHERFSRGEILIEEL